MYKVCSFVKIRTDKLQKKLHNLVFYNIYDSIIYTNGKQRFIIYSTTELHCSTVTDIRIYS